MSVILAVSWVVKWRDTEETMKKGFWNSYSQIRQAVQKTPFHFKLPFVIFISFKFKIVF